MSNVRLPISFLFLLFILTACGGGGGGGGGGGDTPTDPDQEFSLAIFHSTAVGTVYTTPISGSDSNGVDYTGSVSIANRAAIMLDGVLVTPSDTIQSLTGGGSSITVTATGYTDSAGLLVKVIVQTTGLECTPVSPDTIPLTVKIGDFGIRSTLICNDNTTQEINWRVEDAGNGKIDIVTTGTIKNLSSTILQITDVVYTIDGAGEIVGFSAWTQVLSNGYTLNYEST